MSQPDPLAERYARRIRAARAILDLSQAEFGRLIGGVTKKTVGQWERGLNLPRGDQRAVLQQVFDQLDQEDEEQRKALAI